jgi:hypothetical protein
VLTPHCQYDVIPVQQRVQQHHRRLVPHLLVHPLPPSPRLPLFGRWSFASLASPASHHPLLLLFQQGFGFSYPSFSVLVMVLLPLLMMTRIRQTMTCLSLSLRLMCQNSLDLIVLQPSVALLLVLPSVLQPLVLPSVLPLVLLSVLPSVLPA